MANRIKELREAKDWTQEELAAKVNSTGQHVGRFENEKRQLTPRWLQAFGDALGVEPCDLLIFKKTGLAPDRVIFPLRYWDNLTPEIQRSFLVLIKERGDSKISVKEHGDSLLDTPKRD